MFTAIAGLIGLAVHLIDKVIDKTVPDTGQAAKLKAEVARTLMANQQELSIAAADIVKAEAKSEHPLTSQWRPITMLVFVAIIANNYIIAPYVGVIFGAEFSVQLDLPPAMWDLLKIGLGGYIVGRSAEKGIKVWKDKG
jgi:hypothetical protein